VAVIFSKIVQMLAQDIHSYITAFRNAPWETRESVHHQFHYTKRSLAEVEIEKIIRIQEDAYGKITEFLGLASYPEEKISYYLYPDAETKKRLVGSSWFAQSIYNDFAVHALYTEEHRVIGPHEDTHLLSLPPGLSIGFLQEGLAEYMVGHDWYGNQFIEVVSETFIDGKFIFSPGLLIDHQAWLDTEDEYARQYYSLAAFFTGFLIETYGKEKYFNLYASLKRENSTSESEDCYTKVFNISSQSLLNACLQKIL